MCEAVARSELALQKQNLTGVPASYSWLVDATRGIIRAIAHSTGPTHSEIEHNNDTRISMRNGSHVANPVQLRSRGTANTAVRQCVHTTNAPTEQASVYLPPRSLAFTPDKPHPPIRKGTINVFAAACHYYCSLYSFRSVSNNRSILTLPCFSTERAPSQKGV